MKKLLLLCVIFIGLSATAGENVLQSIQIEPVKDTYNVLLTADNAVDVKKIVESPDKISLTMKGIRASKTLNTIYDNVPNVDSVIVEPTGKDSLTIFFQADNAEKSTISFETAIAPISAAKSINRPNPANEILLNKPIKEYSPVYEDDDIAETETSAFSLAGVLQSVKSILMDDKINQIITFGLMGIVFLFGVKLIRRKDNDISVGLSQSLRDREINYYKDVQAKAPSITPVMEKPYSSAYGVNAYRNMSRNPYDTETKHTPVSTPINPVRRQTSIPSTINPRTTSAVRVPNMTNQQAKVAVKQPTITQPAKGDNIKFLEAMSAIYEKSGRYDLAQGIKTSIKKANK